MSNTLRYALLIGWLFCGSLLWAQPYLLKGLVLAAADDTPLPGATVFLEGTSKGALTDDTGKFELEVPYDGLHSITISYLGYQSRTLMLQPGPKLVEIRLESAMVLLDEVVIESDGAYPARPVAGLTLSEGKKASKPSRKRSKPASESYAPAERASEAMMIRGEDAAYREDADSDGVPDLWGSEASESPSPISAGTLTAGEIHDFSKWELWNDLTAGELAQHAEAWQVQAQQRYPVQVQTPQGLPVIDAEVVLQDARGRLLWSARTDNTGKAELWTGMFSPAPEGRLSLQARLGDQTSELLKVVKPFPQGLNRLILDVPCAAPQAVDIAFVVDATGSMRDEIEYLKVELQDVIEGYQRSMPELAVSVSSVFYRDRSDAYLTRHIDFQSSLEPVLKFIRAQSAGGGGDNPEAVEAALAVALDSLSWRTDARARLLFLVLDAPPHQNDTVREQWTRLTQLAARKGVRIIPVTGSGIDKGTEYLMRTLALATNGTYTFLTDHSGVGGAHIEPSTDDYEVELLSNLLSRLLYSYTESPDCENWVPDPAWLVQDTAIAAADSLLAPEDTTLGTESDSLAQPQVIRIDVAPNPTSGPLQVRLSAPVDFIYLSDMNGKILARYPMEKSLRKDLDISSFATGLYLITTDPEKRAKGVKVVLIR